MQELANHVFPKMTAAKIAIRDPAGGFLDWLFEGNWKNGGLNYY